MLQQTQTSKKHVWHCQTRTAWSNWPVRDHSCCHLLYQDNETVSGFNKKTSEESKKKINNGWQFSACVTHTVASLAKHWVAVGCIQVCFSLSARRWWDGGSEWRDEGKTKWEGQNNEFSNAERSLGNWQSWWQFLRSSRQLGTPFTVAAGEVTHGGTDN